MKNKIIEDRKFQIELQRVSNFENALLILVFGFFQAYLATLMILSVSNQTTECVGLTFCFFPTILIMMWFLSKKIDKSYKDLENDWCKEDFEL